MDVESGALGSNQIQAKSDPLGIRAQATVEVNLTAKLPLGTFIIYYYYSLLKNEYLQLWFLLRAAFKRLRFRLDYCRKYADLDFRRSDSALSWVILDPLKNLLSFHFPIRERLRVNLAIFWVPEQLTHPFWFVKQFSILAAHLRCIFTYLGST